MDYAEILYAEIPMEFLWNWDATQFVCKLNPEGKLVCIALDDDDKSPPTIVEKNRLDVLIKYMHMGSAAGECIPLVLLIAVGEMGEDDFDVFEVVGLNVHGLSGMVGYIACCKTRVGNANFFQWFVKSIALPAVSKARDAYNLMVSHILYVVTLLTYF